MTTMTTGDALMRCGRVQLLLYALGASAPQARRHLLYSCKNVPGPRGRIRDACDERMRREISQTRDQEPRAKPVAGEIAPSWDRGCVLMIWGNARLLCRARRGTSSESTYSPQSLRLCACVCYCGSRTRDSDAVPPLRAVPAVRVSGLPEHAAQTHDTQGDRPPFYLTTSAKPQPTEFVILGFTEFLGKILI